jgi:hypothetical protein
MPSHSVKRILAAGLAASLAMAILTVLASRIGMPFLNWSRTLSGPLGNPLFGYLLFFALGVLVALVFALLFHDHLPGQSWQRGFLFAIMMWILTGAALAPLLGFGFFMGSVVASFGTLATYLAYGGVLGYLCDV